MVRWFIPSEYQANPASPVALRRVDALHRRLLREKDPAAFETAARHAQPAAAQDDTLGTWQIGVVVNHLAVGETLKKKQGPPQWGYSSPGF